MIGEADLLQANVTIIAGILIFLTVSPISRDTANKIKEKKSILLPTYTTFGFLLWSCIIVILISAFLEDKGSVYDTYLLIAKLIFLFGLGSLGYTIYNIMKKLPRTEISRSKHHDKDDE